MDYGSAIWEQTISSNVRREQQRLRSNFPDRIAAPRIELSRVDRMSWKKLIHVNAFRAVLRESDDGFKYRSIRKMSQLSRRPAINTSKQWYRSDHNIVSRHSAHTLLLSDQPIPPTWSTYLDNPKNGWARNVQSVSLSSPTVLWSHFVDSEEARHGP